MLIVPAGEGRLEDRHVRDLPNLLRPGDALVVNDARVIRAQLHGYRLRDKIKARIEATLIEQLSPSSWRAMARPAKKLASGDRLSFGPAHRDDFLSVLEAEVEVRGEAGEVTIAFDRSGLALEEAIQVCGSIPLPPYIASRRPPDSPR